MINLQLNIEQQVGIFVRNVSALVRQAAIEALEQAIAVPAPRAEVAKPQRKRGKKGGGVGNGRVARNPAPPRDPGELSALTDHLYQAIASHPGETMEVLAPVVGCPSRDLRVSIEHLLERGRVKKAGQRRSMRYFPMGTDRG